MGWKIAIDCHRFQEATAKIWSENPRVGSSILTLGTRYKKLG